jgi:DNA-binding SARP family transcriptional activator/tetratricopeptide (TPR) repeat protein/DNA-binding XRE family transcriptional regulator
MRADRARGQAGFRGKMAIALDDNGVIGVRTIAGRLAAGPQTAGAMDGNDRRALPVGQLLRGYRQASGFTQRELARRAGVSLGTVRDLEQGRTHRPLPGSVGALAKALGLSPARIGELAAGGPTAGLLVQVLGPLAAWRDEAALPLGSAARQAVLGLLALSAGRMVHREAVIDVLWPDDPPGNAVSLVHAHVSRLRRLLDPSRHPGCGRRGDRGLLVAAGAGYRLQAGPGQLDLLALGELIADARAARGRGDDEAACDWYQEALDLWRGEPVANVDLLRSHPAVIGLSRQHADLVTEYARVASSAGWHDRMLHPLRELAAREPLNEQAHAQLMICLAGCGQQADALTVYQDLCRRLDQELAMPPSPDLAAAHQRVLRQDIPPARPTGTAVGVGAARAGQQAPPLVVLEQLTAAPEPFTGPDVQAPMPNGGGRPVGLTGPASQQFGVALRRRRVMAGLTQQKLAARSGLSVRAIRNLELGRSARPDQRSVRLLAEALSLTGAQRSELSDLVSGRADGTGIAATPGPGQLPAAVAQFVGRDYELNALDELLGQVDGQGAAGGTVVISAIAGTAGIGKTALAVHWARRAAARFPDGQLYMNLCGFDPSAAVAPAQALEWILGALGVAAGAMPASPQARAALYRSVVAGRRLLIVLDNARDTDQVRPLLPGAPGCLVLVTSRASLAGLAVSHSAHVLTLDVLSQDQARQLLCSRIGSARAAAERDAVTELISMCAGLPLALAIVAARACAHPGFPLASLAAELRDASSRLDALDAGDPSVSIRGVLSWSYQRLGEQAARMFRLLGLHPGPDVTVPAAASAAGVALPAARRSVSELTHASLLSEHLPGRLRFHDLLRAYAVEQVMAAEDQQARDDATGRILDHYRSTAANAAFLIDRAHDWITVPPPRPGVTPEHPADHQQALTWMQAEQQVLLAATTLAASCGFDSHAWQIPWTMARCLTWRGLLRDMAAAQRTALAAATRLSDTAGQAESLRLLAHGCAQLNDFDQALEHGSASLRLFQQLGERLGEARVHQMLGALAGKQGRYADALTSSEQALRLYQAAGDQAGEAIALNNVGYIRAQLGDYQQARAICQQALSLQAQLDQRHAKAFTWDSLGYAEQHLGNLAEATACYQRALSIHREFGDRFFEAMVLTHLGDARHVCGEQQQAREAWQQALDILDEMDHPDAERVRGKLQPSA